MPRRLLAHVAGIRPETLSRCLARLRSEGALAPGRSLAIADPGRLEQLARA